MLLLAFDFIPQASQCQQFFHTMRNPRKPLHISFFSFYLEFTRDIKTTHSTCGGTLYPILHSLEKSSYVVSYWQESEIGRKRKYYRITQQGQMYFNQKLNEWKCFTESVNLIMEGDNEDGTN